MRSPWLYIGLQQLLLLGLVSDLNLFGSGTAMLATVHELLGPV